TRRRNNMAIPGTPHTSKQPVCIRERVSGKLPTSADGTPVDPGDALPLPDACWVPTMLHPRELNYLHWLASTLEHRGRVVELGCFLGGSTTALVEGMATRGTHHPPVLAHDGFVLPDDPDYANTWWMKPFRLEPGQNFRKRYEELHASRLDRIEVREGWIPSEITPGSDIETYPEQEPIELLFVDAAKTTGSHRVIADAFFPHLIEGGYLVQQDFMDALLPWLPIHMFQRRDRFEPLDIVRGTPTASFRVIAPHAERAEPLFSVTDLRDSDARAELWRDVGAYWAGYVGRAAGFVHGHAAALADMLGDAEALTRHARAYDAWARSADSAGVSVCPHWAEFITGLASRYDNTSPNRGLRTAIAEQCARAASSPAVVRVTPGDFVAPGRRRHAWSQKFRQLSERGVTRVALFGAGEHTRWLLSSDVDRYGISIACVLDDHPRDETLHGIPVVVAHASSIANHSVDVILPSSDVHADVLRKRACAIARETHATVEPVYEAPATSAPSIDLEPSRAASNESLLVRADPSALDRLAPERCVLGLRERRPWIEAFVEAYAAPAWVSGVVRQREALTLWDVVEATQPRSMIEIGTASGVSTAALAAAVRELVPSRANEASPEIVSYDITDRCYFKTDKRTGAAVAEIDPSLATYIEFHQRATAWDAARRFGVGTVDMAFIDGDHAHPAPTLDVLTLLYTLRPNAWVVLHDVEMRAVLRSQGAAHWNDETGAERLYNAWPFPKAKPTHDDPAMNNIGAIQIPVDPANAVPVLLDLLDTEWETHHKGAPHAIRDALALRTGRASTLVA
ncbi:MAG: class I SAM-dependent methyltransferase, partial [Planctomycetota bacterium]